MSLGCLKLPNLIELLFTELVEPGQQASFTRLGLTLTLTFHMSARWFNRFEPASLHNKVHP